MKNLQPNFAGGILSEGLLARGDLVKYRVGVKDALNVVVRQQGGMANRPGFALAAGIDVTGGTPPVLIPFQLSADEAYVLEFHTNVFRVLLDGSYILDPAVLNRDVTGLSSSVDPVWSFDPTGLTGGSVVYLTAPAGHPLNGQVARVTGLPGDGARLAMADGKPIPIATDVTGVKVSKVFEGSHPYAAAELPNVRYAQDVDYLYLAHKAHPPHRLRRVTATDWTSEVIVFEPGIGVPFSGAYTRSVTAVGSGANPIWTVPGHGLAVGDIVVPRSEPGPWYERTALRVSEVLDADRIRLRFFEGGTLDTSGKPPLPSGMVLEQNVGGRTLSSETGFDTNAVIENYKIAAMNEAGEEGPASPPRSVYIDLTFRGNRAILTWRPTPGAKRYVVYRESGGAYGYIGATEGLFFIDTNIAPDTSQGPQEPRNPFTGAGNYPGVVAFHEQRLFYAATAKDPQVVFASQTANPLNFAVSFPPRDSDALTLRLKHKQINAVRALVSGAALMVMTSGGEWALSGGGADDGRPLTPTNLFLRPVSYWGSAAVEPALIGDVLVMLQRGGRIARDYRMGGERPSDLTIMAADLTRNATIIGWAYCQTPYSVLWVVLSNGALLSMTYNAEHDIWGWARHEVGGGGEVLQVTTILEGDEDALYAVVRRPKVGGGTIIQTERMARRMDELADTGVYLDAARTIWHTDPVSTARGLIHLAGRTVTALVDGNVYHGLTVNAAGEVSIGARAGRRWTVGFPYASAVETLPFEEEATDGSTMGAKRRAVSAHVLVERTRGVWAGDAPERMEQVKEWAVLGDDVERIPLKTTLHRVDFAGDWATRPTVRIEQRDPLPFTLLGVAPEWQFGG